jgi:5-methylcytosine-specific restriction endonuclease McrA
VNKECKKHGVTPHIQEPSGYWRCKRCRNDSVSEARRRRKRKLVELAGGSCQLCGYDKCVAALQFHHKDPTKKKFGIAASGVTRSLEEQKEEISKCILLCANCHAEEHDEQ